MYPEDPDPVGRYAHDHSVEHMLKLDAAALGVGLLSRRYRWIKAVVIGVVAFTVITLAILVIHNLIAYGQIAP